MKKEDIVFFQSRQQEYEMRIPATKFKWPKSDIDPPTEKRPTDGSDIPMIKIKQFGIPPRFIDLLEKKYQHIFSDLEDEGTTYSSSVIEEWFNKLNFEKQRLLIINYPDGERESAERLMWDIACRAAKEKSDIKFHWISGLKSCVPADGSVWDDLETEYQKHIIAWGPLTEGSKNIDFEITRCTNEFIPEFANHTRILLTKSRNLRVILDRLDLPTETLIFNLGKTIRKKQSSMSL